MNFEEFSVQLKLITYEIGSLVTIGDYIGRGLEIPQLSENILKIAESTAKLLIVLKNIISRSDDQKFVGEGSEYSDKIYEHNNKLNSSAVLFKESNKKIEASKLLLSGANGILTDVINFLACYDDSEVRKIELHLKEMEKCLKMPISFKYEELVNLLNTLKINLIEAMKLLISRVPEIISLNVAALIEKLTSQLKDQTTKFVSKLMDVESAEDLTLKDLCKKQACSQKFDLLLTILELLYLIWKDDIPNRVDDIFIGILPQLTEIAQNYIKDETFQKSGDTSGEDLYDFLFKRLNEISQKYPQLNHNLSKNLLHLKSDLLSFLKARKEGIEPKVSPSGIVSKVEAIKNDFELNYNQWVIKKLDNASSVKPMMINLSACQTFDEWESGVKAICHDSNCLINLYSQTESNKEIKETIDDIQQEIESRSIQDSYKNKDEKYTKINDTVEMLTDLTSQYICEKVLDELYATTQAHKDFSQAINICHNAGTKAPGHLPQTQKTLDQSKKNVEDLSKIVLKTLQTYPVPLKSIFTIENSLDKINNQNSFMSFAFEQFKKFPKNTQIKDKINEACSEINKSTIEIVDEILSHLSYNDVLNYLTKETVNGQDLIKEGFNDKDQAKCINGCDKIKFCLDSLIKKNKSEACETTSEERKKELEEYCHDLEKMRNEFIEKSEAFLNSDFDENRLSELSNVVSQFQSTIEDEIDLSKIKDNEEALEIHLEIMPAAEKTVTVEVPQKYKLADAIIHNPNADDRIAVAASKLHQEVQSKHIREDNLSNAVVEISYMFADMSRSFQDPNSQSLVIQNAKDIALKTNDVIAYARQVLESCRDPRLRQLLACSIEKLPTISHQLKILSTLRASSLKSQSFKKNKLGQKDSKQVEDSNYMLIVCAENLMKNIQETVKAIESAKIRSKKSNLTKVTAF